MAVISRKIIKDESNKTYLIMTNSQKRSYKFNRANIFPYTHFNLNFAYISNFSLKLKIV